MHCAARALAETEFLAREIAAVRLAVEQKADRAIRKVNAVDRRIDALVKNINSALNVNVEPKDDHG